MFSLIENFFVAQKKIPIYSKIKIDGKLRPQ